MSNKIYIITIIVLSISVVLLGCYVWKQKYQSNTISADKYVFKTFYSEAEGQWYIGVTGYLDNTCQIWNGLKTEINGTNVSIAGYYKTDEEIKENNDGICSSVSYPFEDYAFLDAPKEANFTFNVIEGDIPN